MPLRALVQNFSAERLEGPATYADLRSRCLDTFVRRLFVQVSGCSVARTASCTHPEIVRNKSGRMARESTPLNSGGDEWGASRLLVLAKQQGHCIPHEVHSGEDQTAWITTAITAMKMDWSNWLVESKGCHTCTPILPYQPGCSECSLSGWLVIGGTKML